MDRSGTLRRGRVIVPRGPTPQNVAAQLDCAASPAHEMSPNVDELHAWLALSHAPGIGRRLARALLEHFGSPAAALRAPPEVLEPALDASKRQALAGALSQSEPVLHQVLQWLSESPANTVLTAADPDYPPRLLHSPDPPLLLFLQGQRPLLSSQAVGVVGSRHATPQGRLTAHRLAHELGGLGIATVSGLALGIDAAAHEGALEAAEATGGPSTIAVIGNGHWEIYPRQNRRLYERLQYRGLIMSEYPPAHPSKAENFPQRNRIIAGLVSALTVVEATLRSGSLITARLAVEAGRDVFAVPGPISSAQSAGCHRLIKQGAGLLECAQDILEASPWAYAAAAQGASTHATVGSSRDGSRPAPAPLERCLAGGPLTLDDIAHAMDMDQTALNALLLEAELSGTVARLPGGRFQWVSPAA